MITLCALTTRGGGIMTSEEDECCFGCGAPEPKLASDYQHFTAYYCGEKCRDQFHLESSGKHHGRVARVRHKVKKAGKKASKALSIQEPRVGDEFSASESQ